MTGPTRVALVDDHRFLQQTLAIALQDCGFETVLVDPAQDVVQQVRSWAPSVVLLDLGLHAGAGGDELIPVLATTATVLVLTAETDRARWGRCLLAGAGGVLSKGEPLDVVVRAVGDAAQGRLVGDPAERTSWLRLADQHRAREQRELAAFRTLTPREAEVLAALVEGECAADIASRATLSEATVRSHIRSVLAKLGVGSQLQAVARVRRAGWDRSPR